VTQLVKLTGIQTAELISFLHRMAEVGSVPVECYSLWAIQTTHWD